MAAKKRKKRTSKRRKTAKKKGHVPLSILKKRLVKLAKVVASRSKKK